MKKLIFGFALLFVAIPCAARIITVDDNGPADFNNIQAAIDDANDGDTVEVQPGRYTGPGNHDIDFKGKAITVRSIDPNDPDVVAATIIDGEGNYDWCLEGWCEEHRGFHFHSGEDPNSVLAGFTVTKFCAPDIQRYHQLMPGGAGILCEDSSPTINRCIIINNWAHHWGEGIGGGGIHSRGGNPIITHSTISDNEGYVGAGGIDCEGGSPIVSQCLIINNHSSWAGGGISCGSGSTIINCAISGNSGGVGGGIEGSPFISNCVITGNSAIWHGGGIYGSPIVSHCTIANNTVPYGGYGGGIYCTSSNCTISHCVISGNSVRTGYQMEEWVDGVGGGIYCGNNNPTINQCTITANTADANGGGIYGNPTLTNSIIWGNHCPKEPQIYGLPDISYSDIQGGFVGLGNIDIDPVFADTAEGDYHLKSQVGRWDPRSKIWVRDDITSPCIDAGNPGCPVGDEPAPNGNRINMGAYGGTDTASKSPANWSSIADLTNDNRVDVGDLELLAQYWLGNEANLPADLNRNQLVDLADFAIFADNWLWP
jgi:parallel beta-helix repeat protein